MGFLGLLVYLGAFGYALYFGYMVDFRPGVLLLIPIGMMVGQIIIRGSKSASVFRRQGLGVLVELLSNYIVALVVTAIAFGIGYGIAEILTHRPVGY